MRRDAVTETAAEAEALTGKASWVEPGNQGVF